MGTSKIDYYKVGGFIIENFGLSSRELSKLIESTFKVYINHVSIQAFKKKAKEDASKLAAGDEEYAKLLMNNEMDNLKLLYEATLKIKEKLEQSESVDSTDFKNFCALISQLLNAISLNQRRLGEYRSEVRVIKFDPVELFKELKRMYKESDGKIEGERVVFEKCPQLVDAIRRSEEIGK